MSDIVQMKVEKRERSGTGSSRDLKGKELCSWYSLRGKKRSGSN